MPPLPSNPKRPRRGSRIASGNSAGVHCAKTLHFVGVLTNPDNTRDYQFLGSIFDGERYAHGKKSKIGYDAPSAVAFRWFWSVVDHIEQIEGVRFYKSSYCCRCGRTLTVPESINLGIGPECAQQVGLVPYGWEEEPRAHRGGQHDEHRCTKALMSDFDKVKARVLCGTGTYAT